MPKFNIFKKLRTPDLEIRATFMFTALFMIMLVLFSAVLTIIFSYRSDIIITKSSTWALEQMTDFTDKYIFENIDGLCDTFFNKDSESELMQTFFQDMDSLSYEDMQSIQNELSNIKRHNSFLDNIILYNGKFDSIVSTNDNIVYGATDTRNHLSIQNRFFSYVNEIYTDFYVPQDDNVMLENQKDYILYVHYVSRDETSSFGKMNVNCVIMAVDINVINSFINEIDMPGVQCFAILDKDLRMLIHSDDFPEPDSIKENNPSSYSKLISMPKGSYRMKFQNTNANYIWMQSGIKDWKYVYIMSTREWYRQLMIVVLCTACTALLILLLVYVLTRRLSKRIYKPFSDAVNKAKISLASETHSDNEIEFLNNLIDDFSQKEIEYDSLNKKYSELYRHQTAATIINGLTNDTSDTMINMLSGMGIDFSRRLYSLIIVEFNKEILNTFSYEQSNFILYDVMEVLYDAFNCIVALTSSNTIALVINDTSIDYGYISTTFRRLITEKSLINLYMCGETDTIKGISELYNKSLTLTKYSYIHGFDNTFYAGELSERELDNSIIDRNAINRIENALRNGSKTQFYDECNSILTGVKRDRHSFGYAQNAVMSILSAICRVARELGISIAEEDTFKKIMNNTFFDDSTIYLFEFSDKIFDTLTEKKSSMKEGKRYDLIANIKEYIDRHITEDVSLSSVAGQFNISVGYLSKFFKESTSESFSKYIIEKKFGYAARMLLEAPSRSISEIANDLGYFDSAYFSRQFKAHYGVTPVQYRKMNHIK